MKGDNSCIGLRKRTFLCILIGVGVVYLMVYLRQFEICYSVPKPLKPLAEEKTRKPSNNKNNKNNCSEWFQDDFDDNLNVIDNYHRGIADAYLPLIGGNLSEPLEMSSYPVIVTGADSSHYGESQGLIKSIHEHLIPKYKGLRIIYYDIGLKAEQRTTKHCKCEVRSFPFEQFPKHVRTLKTYAFKPIIVQKTLMEFGVVWWVDASIRFKTDDLTPAVEYAKTNGLLAFTVHNSIAQHTDKQTLLYLKEDVCKFRQFGENEAGYVLFYWNSIARVVVRSWASCAINVDCIAPPGTTSKLYCDPTKTNDGKCHRFDQAVLSIMYRRLYHDKNHYNGPNSDLHRILAVKREKVNYFPVKTQN